MRPPAIEVRHLGKAYGSTTAVRDVSFTVGTGEVLGVLGPNGAGKTTTVECVVGLRDRDRGEISVLGHDPADRDAITRLVGVQTQAVALPDRLKVGEAMELWASFYENPWETGDLLEAVELGDARGAYVGKLSGGQRQRLSVAIALVGDPRVAVLDELTTGLDPAARRRVWSLVERLRQKGTTVLLVSHLMPEVERLCDRVVVVDHGVVIATGTPEEITAGHRSLDDAFIALTEEEVHA